MNLLQLLVIWYLYSKFYILGAVLVTHILNVSFKKLWLSPLLVNAGSLLVLVLGIMIQLIKTDEIFPSVLFVYLPIVSTSIIMNCGLMLYKKIRRINNE